MSACDCACVFAFGGGQPHLLLWRDGCIGIAVPCSLAQSHTAAGALGHLACLYVLGEGEEGRALPRVGFYHAHSEQTLTSQQLSAVRRRLLGERWRDDSWTRRHLLFWWQRLFKTCLKRWSSSACSSGFFCRPDAATALTNHHTTPNRDAPGSASPVLANPQATMASALCCGTSSAQMAQSGRSSRLPARPAVHCNPRIPAPVSFSRTTRRGHHAARPLSEPPSAGAIDNAFGMYTWTLDQIAGLAFGVSGCW